MYQRIKKKKKGKERKKKRAVKEPLPDQKKSPLCWNVTILHSIAEHNKGSSKSVVRAHRLFLKKGRPMLHNAFFEEEKKEAWGLFKARELSKTSAWKWEFLTEARTAFRRCAWGVWCRRFWRRRAGWGSTGRGWSRPEGASPSAWVSVQSKKSVKNNRHFPH